MRTSGRAVSNSAPDDVGEPSSSATSHSTSITWSRHAALPSSASWMGASRVQITDPSGKVTRGTPRVNGSAGREPARLVVVESEGRHGSYQDGVSEHRVDWQAIARARPESHAHGREGRPTESRGNGAPPDVCQSPRRSKQQRLGDRSPSSTPRSRLSLTLCACVPGPRRRSPESSRPGKSRRTRR